LEVLTRYNRGTYLFHLSVGRMNLFHYLERWRQQVSAKVGVYQTTRGHVPHYCRHFVLVKGVLNADCFDITFHGSNINVS
jgi:hypothetical protein